MTWTRRSCTNGTYGDVLPTESWSPYAATGYFISQTTEITTRPKLSILFRPGPLNKLTQGRDSSGEFDKKADYASPTSRYVIPEGQHNELSNLRQSLSGYNYSYSCVYTRCFLDRQLYPVLVAMCSFKNIETHSGLTLSTFLIACIAACFGQTTPAGTIKPHKAAFDRSLYLRSNPRPLTVLAMHCQSRIRRTSNGLLRIFLTEVA